MTSFRAICWASLLLLHLALTPLRAANRELATISAAVEVVHALPAVPPHCIPPALLHDAKAVAVFTHVVKAGLLVDRRFGRGVLMVRQPDGTWSEPMFITLTGGGLGLEAGVEATDLVLVFRTEKSLDRILKGNGRLTLGADAAIAAGPLGKEAEASTAVLRKAEVYSYSRSRGLFAGLSLEGDHVAVDTAANEEFYHLKGGRPVEILALRGVPLVAPVVQLREHLVRLGTPPLPPVPARP
jgi:lipid-binding SYLF domain-containing protein